VTLITVDKMSVAYGNYVNATDVAAVTSTNITALVSGFPLSNLKYPDPWTMTKTNGISGGDPTIKHEFNAPVAVGAIGIINHNLGSGYYSTVEVHSSPDDAVWTLRGQIVVPALNNNDMIIPINETAGLYWRLTFTSASADFYIGSIFYGVLKTLDTNVNNAGYIQYRNVPVIVEESAGGARHVAFGADKKTSSVELRWSRAAMSVVSWFDGRPNYELLGIIGPEQGDMDDNGDEYSGANLFWGYKVDDTTAPIGPGQMATSQQAKYAYTVYMEGAV